VNWGRKGENRLGSIEIKRGEDRKKKRKQETVTSTTPPKQKKPKTNEINGKL